MKKLFVLIALVLLGSCASESEQKGLQAISAEYEGNATYSKSFNSSMGQQTFKSFNVRLSNSARIDTLPPAVTTGNIARMAYESFSEKERSSYTHVSVELINSKNDTASYQYPMSILPILAQKAKTFKDFSAHLVRRDFKKIDALKNDEEIPGAIGERIGITLSEMEKSFGKLTAYESFGISEIEDAKGSAYQYQGYLVFGNGIHKPYFVFVDTKPEDDRMIGFRVR